MRKVTIVIDDELVEQACEILGTRSLKDTIDRALRQVITAEARRALIRRFETHDGLDLNEETLRQAWGR